MIQIFIYPRPIVDISPYLKKEILHITAQGKNKI